MSQTRALQPKRQQADLVNLSGKAKAFIRQSKSKNTLRAYKSAWVKFVSFCDDIGAGSLPATPATVIEYLVAMADGSLRKGKPYSVNTISQHLAAIAWAHRVNEVTDPTVFEAVKAALAGIKRDLGTRPAKKEPATLDEIAAMMGTLPRTAKGKRDKALLLVGFAGAFRRSELVGLDVSDVRMNGALKILVKRSKTDQEAEGQVKVIPAIGGDLCPLAALKAWLDVAAINSGPIFRSVDRHGNVSHKRLTAQSVAHVIKRAAKAAGLDWRSFSGHSLRAGFVTEAMNAGASDSDIMEQTGHKTQRVMRDYRKSSGVGASRAVKAIFGSHQVGAEAGA